MRNKRQPRQGGGENKGQNQEKTAPSASWRMTVGIHMLRRPAPAGFHKIIEYPLTGKRGRPRKHRRVPDNQLRYAQVVKIRDKGKVVSVLKRVIYGNEEDVDHSQVSTSLIERENLSLRQENCRLTRKTIAFSKLVYYLNCQLTLYVSYHNFVRPHRALFQKINEVVVGRVRRKWKRKTPAMAAGITDHVWTLRELLTFKVTITSTN